MHEMQSILTDVHGVCQSVRLSRGSSVWGEHSLGPQNIVFGRGPDPPKRGEGASFNFWNPPHISRMAEARD